MSDAETTSPTKQIQPPYGSVMWYDKFFKLLERIQIDKVDSSFLKTNDIAAGNEYKVINGLRFLGLIDENGKAMERMSSLRVVGEEYTTNFEKMVRDAYSVLISKVELEKALADDAVNKLITEYGMARSTAKQGTKIFVFLAQKAGMTISTSLAEYRKEELEVTRQKGKETNVVRKKKETKTEEEMDETETMYVGRLGDNILIKLRKGDRELREKIAEHVKKLLELYVEGEEIEN
jgi:hypothetical protein